MRRQAVLITSILALASARPACGRLWETEEQLQNRYGHPIKKVENSPDGGKLYSYRFKEYNILVSIIGGESQNEFYTRQDGKPLNENQIIFFHIENQGNDHWWWHRKLPMRVLGQWRAVSATFNRIPTTDAPGLEICTLSYARRVNLITTENLPNGIPFKPPS